MSITPISLAQVSTYSSDYQNILNRAVGIAKIPLTRLQNKDAAVLRQKTDLGSISDAAGGVVNSLQALGALASTQATSASSSDPTVLTATASGPAAASSYTINSVTSLASAAAERSLNGYADASATPVSSTGTVQLTVGTHNYTISLAHNNLVSLRDQINTLGAGVTASILTTANGNYLSLGASAPGATTLALKDDPGGANTALLTTSNQGSDAQFQLNGITVTQTSNTVNSIIPGVTFQLVGRSATPVTISLATDPAKLSSALQTFVNSLNTLNAGLRAQVGTGSLAGDNVVTGLQNTLNQLKTYDPHAGGIRSLATLGITFDATGKASFDQTTFNSLGGGQIADAFKFLGSAGGGLAGFARNVSQYSDSVNGLIATEQTSLTRADQHLQSQIATLSDRINVLQKTLANRLAIADTHVAHLQAQQNTLTASLQGLSYVLYGKSTQG